MVTYMKINFSDLTDAEIAFLTYAVQTEHDRISRESDWNQDFIDLGSELRECFSKEYKNRKLHYEQFEKSEMKRN